jgi:hypothetical protein
MDIEKNPASQSAKKRRLLGSDKKFERLAHLLLYCFISERAMTPQRSHPIRRLNWG